MTAGRAGAQTTPSNLVYDSNTSSTFLPRSAVSAGSVLVGGLTDIQGGVYSTASGVLSSSLDSVDASTFLRDFLVRPVGENAQDQRIVVDLPAAWASFSVITNVILRYQSGNKNGYMMGITNSGTPGLQPFKLTGSPAAASGAVHERRDMDRRLHAAHTYQIDAQAVGVSPTVITVKVYDTNGITNPAPDAGSLVMSATGSDSSAALRPPEVWAWTSTRPARGPARRDTRASGRITAPYRPTPCRRHR